MCSDEQEVKYGAVAVVMAGNHNDNADTGETFIHTGEGGQKDGKQVCCNNTGPRTALRQARPYRLFVTSASASTAVQLAQLKSKTV
jgi:hypothetical protein